MGKGFEPKVVVFCCNWCSPSVGGDELPDSVKLIRVMCTGRVHPGLLLRAIELGSDGVLVLGCPPKECHYSFGADKAEEMFEVSKGLSRLLGLEDERLRFERVQDREGDHLVEMVTRFVEGVKKRGPSSLRPS